MGAFEQLDLQFLPALAGLRQAVEEHADVILVHFCERPRLRTDEKGPCSSRREPDDRLQCRAARPRQGQVHKLLRHDGRLQQARGRVDAGSGALKLDAGIRPRAGKLQVPAGIRASRAKTEPAPLRASR